MLWAYINGGIGRQYSTSTTLSDVKQRLEAEFEQLFTLDGNSLVARIIASVVCTVTKFEDDIRQESRQEQEELLGDTTEPESSDDDLSISDI